MANQLGLFLRPGFPDDFSDPTENPADVCRKLAASRLRVGWLMTRGDNPRHVSQFLSDAEELLRAADAAARGEEITIDRGGSDLVQHAEALVDALVYDDAWTYEAEDFAALQEFALGLLDGIRVLCEPRPIGSPTQRADAGRTDAPSPQELEQVFGIERVRALFEAVNGDEEAVSNQLMTYLEARLGRTILDDDEAFDDDVAREQRQRLDASKPLGFYDGRIRSREATVEAD